jgi:hypothetical protein
MKRSKRSFAVVSVLFPLLLSFSTGTLNARDADLVNTCRARFRDCRSLKQIPLPECRGIYQDCTRNTCGAGAADRPSWAGFPR